MSSEEEVSKIMEFLQQRFAEQNEQFAQQQQQYAEQQEQLNKRFESIDLHFEMFEQRLQQLESRRSSRQATPANSEVDFGGGISQIDEEATNQIEEVQQQEEQAEGPVHEQQYIDPDLLQTRIEDAVQQAVLNATQVLREEEQPRRRNVRRQTIQEALRQADEDRTSQVVLTQQDNSYLKIQLTEITLDGFMTFMEKIAEYEKRNYNRAVPSVYSLLKDRARDMVRHTLRRMNPTEFPTYLECTDARITHIIEAVKRLFKPLDVMAFNKILYKSCKAYKVNMERLEDFRKADEDICILETKFIQRYDFLVDAAKVNHLTLSIPLTTTKRGGSLEVWMSLIPPCMRDTSKRLLRTENFNSVESFFEEFFEHLRVTRELSEKYQQFKGRFNFQTKPQLNAAILAMMEEDDSDENEKQTKESNNDAKDDDLKSVNEDVMATEVYKKSPCFKEMNVEGGCKDKSCKFSHDKEILKETLRAMNARFGIKEMPTRTSPWPQQRTPKESVPWYQRKLGNEKGDVRMLVREQEDQGDTDPIDDL